MCVLGVETRGNKDVKVEQAQKVVMFDEVSGVTCKGGCEV